MCGQHQAIMRGVPGASPGDAWCVEPPPGLVPRADAAGWGCRSPSSQLCAEEQAGFQCRACAKDWDILGP